MKFPFHMIKEASEQEFANARKEAPNGSETTPPSITNEVREFAASLGGDEPAYVPVTRDDHGLYGWCSDGVEAKVAACGGSIAYGWTIWEWPGALLTAEFHAVWRDQAGVLFDITPKPAAEDKIVFVYDSSYPQNFDFDNRPGNRRTRLYKVADPAPAIAAAKTRLTGAKLGYEERRAAKAGLTLDEPLERKLPVDRLAAAIDDVIAACNAFEQHYDSLGSSGPVQPDEKLFRLMRRRLSAQKEMKRLLN
jgi:hypothetical protein